SETAWGGATDPADGPGSGCSIWEPKTTWQKDAGCSMRSVADVSAVADPGTGVAIYNSDTIWGGWNVVGGTSVASPIIASVYALAGRRGGARATTARPDSAPPRATRASDTHRPRRRPLLRGASSIVAGAVFQLALPWRLARARLSCSRSRSHSRRRLRLGRPSSSAGTRPR